MKVKQSVTDSLAQAVSSLSKHADATWQFGRGIEKESLRIDREGNLAQTPHPPALGSALSHPQITTDFSEALLELITGVHYRIDDTLGELYKIHQYVYHVLDKQDEILWTQSMPCVLNKDEGIPLAEYGSSNVAKMKHTYRMGLGHRYGRPMQAIAGIHYNWSVPAALWDQLIQDEGYTGDRQAFITDRYLGLIRNFRRYSWLLYLVTGASPAICRSFLDGAPHNLDQMGQGTLFAEHGTSLRMGDLGYTSDAQSSLEINYNDLPNYIATLKQGLTTKVDEYADIGVKVNGQYKQLSDAILQIENEFYSPVRPKRVAQSGETPIKALASRGIEYIEVRCVDLNPFNAIGIDRLQAHFIDAFLLFCLLEPSALETTESINESANNTQLVVNQGRAESLTLNDQGQARSVTEWANALCDQIASVATLFDQAEDTDQFSLAVQAGRAVINSPTNLPAAKVLQGIQASNDSFSAYAMASARDTAEFFRQAPPSAEEIAEFEEKAVASIDKQREIEASDTISFDEYLANYYEQYNAY